jgi:nucleotide-binding universal stress UspA family protein
MTDTPAPVLVGVDGTASGHEAVALGTAIAILTSAPLVLGAVYGYEGAFMHGLTWPTADEAERWLDEAAERLGNAVPWSARAVSAPSAAAGIDDLAIEIGAQMIVLGSSRRGPIGRVLAGSTVRAVLQAAPCAVAVAPHDWRIQPPDMPLTFGIALDDSRESREALTCAAALAKAGRTPLRAITVLDHVSPAHPMFAATGTSYEGWERDRRAAAEKDAREAVAGVETDTEIVVLEGDPGEQLAAASHDLDLLVLGSRRYGPVRRALLGSVSSHLIETAACPLVIVPRGIHLNPT